MSNNPILDEYIAQQAPRDVPAPKAFDAARELPEYDVAPRRNAIDNLLGKQKVPQFVGFGSLASVTGIIGVKQL